MRDKVIIEEIEIPKGVTAVYAEGIIKIKGSKGETSMNLIDPKIKIIVENGKIIVKCETATKREKAKIGTFNAHIKNLVKGATEGFVFKLKICSGHFPMNVTVTKDQFTVKNFLGEKVPRVLKLKQGAKVVVDGTLVTVEGINREIAGQVAADIEQLCRITNRDRRIFQDGIFITNKAGKEIA